ncbi:triose-phosphate isomerase [Saccharomonospora viridis]|nr:triose-phosphate isomerase [Saccharomonospora viridis]
MPVWMGTSWKMNKTLAQARDYTVRLVKELGDRDLTGVQPFIIPPFTALATVREIAVDDPRVILGAQNAHWDDAGAWTGEISVPQALDAGARIIEIGHSERRQHFGETIETTRLKVAAALRHGALALLCVGEPAEVRDAGRSTAYILEQAEGALAGLSDEQLRSVLIAYEPIWAIGEAGRPATPEELRGPFAALRERFGDRVRGLLYGGSVNQDNAPDLLRIDGVDGLFVGRAAWEVEGFLALLDIATAHNSTDS